MESRHQEYVDYYRVRYEKVAREPSYPHTARAEWEMYQAIAGAPSLEAFGEILQSQGLNVKVAVARVRDQYTARARFYSELQETVRAGASLEILQNLDAKDYTDVMDLMSMVSDVETRWMIHISSDEHLIEEFWGDWKVLEDIECMQYAPVPDRWCCDGSTLGDASGPSGGLAGRLRLLCSVRPSAGSVHAPPFHAVTGRPRTGSDAQRLSSFSALHLLPGFQSFS